MTTVPWKEETAFPEKPEGKDYGFYSGGKKLWPCSPEELAKRCSKEDFPSIKLVWTPETTRLVPPEEVDFLHEPARRRLAYLAKLSIGMGLVYLAIGILFLLDKSEKDLSHRVLLIVALGVIPLVQGIWRLAATRTWTPEKISKRAALARYTAWVATRKIILTRIIALCLVVAGVMQIKTGAMQSFVNAGLDKEAVRQGEFWRLLTYGVLHGNPMHFMFNFLALFALGRLVEVVGHHAYLAIVFLASILIGGIFSQVLLPQVNSVGASGGLMGLIGFMAVLGVYRKSMLPPDFVKWIVISIALIAAMGIFAYDLIDNAAHLGGLLCGISLGVLLIKKRDDTLPIQPGQAVSLAGIIAMTLILAVTVFAVLLMLR
jgi:membrane associated rhomboid family serine protease